ncbi:MAG: sigma-70 family RNA polymerase sigma factor [Cyanobacteriota bacterium]|nr:sigma-70 family RNA polymerase sigma factor [Cyanobacteriota bacterium]
MPAPQKRPRGGCDAFGRHLSFIGRIPLLTPEEEITQARAVQQGLRLMEIKEELKLRGGGMSPSQEAWAAEARLSISRLERQIRHAERAKERMVTANLRLVVSVARKYAHHQLELEDLIQEGTLGLIKAVDRFDPARGYRFSTYAYWWIREGISRALADKSRSIRLPAHMVDLLSKLRRAQQTLWQELGRTPNLSELAFATGFKPLDIREALFRAREPLSLDSAKASQNELRLMDSLRCTASAPQDRLTELQLRQDLEGVLAELPAHEAELLRLRYGMNGADPMNLCAVARELGITRDTARGIERRANAAIRRLSNRVIDYLET